jgi:pyridoxamine 5'-phosphate oxidase
VNLDDLDLNPHVQFGRWFAEAAAAGVHAPEQMALATTGPDARPSVRMVLLKGHDERSFVFYTNRTSKKAGEI